MCSSQNYPTILLSQNHPRTILVRVPSLLEEMLPSLKELNDYTWLMFKSNMDERVGVRMSYRALWQM